MWVFAVFLKECDVKTTTPHSHNRKEYYCISVIPPSWRLITNITIRKILEIYPGLLHWRLGFDPWVGKIPWRRKRQPTPVLLPRKSYGRRSLVQATVHGVTKSRARLSNFPFPFFLSALQADSLPAEPPGKPKVLEWGVYPFSRGSSQPRNRTGVSCIAGGFFTNWAIREAMSRKWP